MSDKNVKVTVTPRSDGFEVQAESFSGQTQRVVVARQLVIQETARALNSILHDKHPVELNAPDWVKVEIERRGFRV